MVQWCEYYKYVPAANTSPSHMQASVLLQV